MEVTQIVLLYMFMYTFHQDVAASACITGGTETYQKGQLSVCPYPIIINDPNQVIPLEILCNASGLPGTPISITLSKVSGNNTELVIRSSLITGTSKWEGYPNRTNPMAVRFLYHVNDSYVKIDTKSAQIEDLICSYECTIQTIFEHRSVIKMHVGVPPGTVGLTISPKKSVYDKEDIFTLLCTATACLFRNDTKEESVSDYVFQYSDQSQWITIDVSQSDAGINPSHSGPTYNLSLRNSNVRGMFVAKAYSLEVKANSIPKGYRQYRCYLFLFGHYFEHETSETVRACVSHTTEEEEGGLKREGSKEEGEEEKDTSDVINVSLIAGLAVGGFGLLPLIVLCVTRAFYGCRDTSEGSTPSFVRIVSLLQTVRRFVSSVRLDETVDETYENASFEKSNESMDNDYEICAQAL